MWKRLDSEDGQIVFYFRVSSKIKSEQKNYEIHPFCQICAQCIKNSYLYYYEITIKSGRFFPESWNFYSADVTLLFFKKNHAVELFSQIASLA